MAVALIYHNLERNLAEDFGGRLERCGHKICYAPPGLQVGTPEWQARVRSDLENADAVLLLITPLSALDEWVGWRAGIAIENKSRFVPIFFKQDELSDPAQWRLPEQVLLYNGIFISDEFIDKAIERLSKHFLSSMPRRCSCFLSYSRKDEDLARRLQSDLEREKIRTWRDEDDIPAGDSWDEQISRAIQACTHVLFLVTPNSVQSQNVADEISFAREEKKPILPLIFQQARLPLRVHRAQAIDFTGDYEAAFKKLLVQLK